MTHRTGMLLVFLAGVLWSTVGLGIRLIEQAEVWQILLYRSISLSVFLFFVIQLRTGQNPIALAWHRGLPGVVAALGLVAAYSGAIYSIQNTSVANAMLLFSSAPFAAAILGWFVLGERVRPATWIAVLIGAVGVVVMINDKGGTGTISGNLAALFSALGFAVFTVALRWGKSSDMLPAVFLSGLFAIVITTTVCLATGLPLVLSHSDTSIAMVMGVGQVGMGLLLFTIGSKTVPAVELTLLSMAEVVLGPVWVWVFLGEVASVNTVIGGGILLAAILGNAVTGMRRKPTLPMP